MEQAGILEEVFHEKEEGRLKIIDTYVKGHYDMMRHKYQDRDWSEEERTGKEAQYETVRNSPEQFPEGLIDDVEPPL
jgi:hypothetical protein